MAFREQQHPFYKPLWRRIVIVAVVAAWVVFEFVTSSSPLWIMLAVAFLIYAVYMFFITWPKDDEPPPG